MKRIIGSGRNIPSASIAKGRAGVSLKAGTGTVAVAIPYAGASAIAGVGREVGASADAIARAGVRQWQG